VLSVPLLTLAVLAGLVSTADPAAAGTLNPQVPTQVRPVMTGYIPYWTVDASLASFEANADLFTDVVGFFHSAKGTTSISDDLSASGRAAVVSAVHAKGVKILGAVTDGMAARGMTGVLTTGKGRAAHADRLVKLAVDNDYDGIDLDYEKFAFSDGSSTWPDTNRRWVAFIKTLSAKLHAKGLLLTVSVPVMYNANRDGSSGYWVYDYKAIGPYVDRLRIMTYDYSVSSTGPIAPLSWVRRVLDFATTQVPASKIRLGMPAYGRDWPQSTSGCPSDNLPSKTSLTSRAAIALAKSVGETPTWNSTYGERTFSYRKTYTGASTSCTITRTVWFEEDSAAITRARLVGEYKLGGLAQWTIGGEDPDQWSRIRDYALGIAKVSPRLELNAGDAVHGATVHITGRLNWVASGTPIAGEDWSLYWRNADSSTWTRVAGGRTVANGRFAIDRKPTRNGYWKVWAGGSWSRLSAWTAENRTLVRTAVSASFTDSTVRYGHTATLKGSIGPAVAGLRAERQVYRGGAWETVGATTTTTAGTYAFTFRPTQKVTYKYRVRITGSTWRADGYSPTITLTVG
jgi:spore germination protein YaaH